MRCPSSQSIACYIDQQPHNCKHCMVRHWSSDTGAVAEGHVEEKSSWCCPGKCRSANTEPHSRRSPPHALSPAATRSAALAKAGWCSSNPVAGDIPCRAAKVCAAEEVISTDSACKDILQHAISHLNPSHKNCPTLQFQSCWTQFCILGTRSKSVVLAVGLQLRAAASASRLKIRRRSIGQSKTGP